MSERYGPLLEAVKTAMGAINVDRVVTREWKRLQDYPQSDLERGIWTIRFAGVDRYPYEASDSQLDTDDARATANGRVRLTIIGQLKLAEDASGLDIEAAELALIHELEQLADEAIETDELMALLIKDATTSQQVEAPYAWVYSTWEVFPLN